MKSDMLIVQELIKNLYPEETQNIDFFPDTILRRNGINLEGGSISFELSSIQCIELIVEIEQKYNITIDIEQLDGFRTMGDLINIIQQYRSN